MMDKGMAVAGGAGLGAGLMYLFDPDRGRRRRALTRDKLARAANETEEAIETVGRDARNRGFGVWASLRSWFSSDEVSDDVLAARVRSRIGMLVRHPRAIEVEADRGTITLSGPVLEDEVNHLLRGVSRIAGVRRVRSRLEIHRDANHVPALQGDSEERFEQRQRNWSPTARVLTGAAGSALALYGIRHRSLFGASLAVLGFGLLARGTTNRELRRFMDTRPSRTRPRPRPAGRRRQLVRDVMTPHVEVIDPEATLEEAAEKMKALNIGAIPVCDGDRIVGILTDRDIVIRIVGEKREPKAAKARDAMTPDLSYCFEDDDVQTAARSMAENQIRRLIVLNRDKQLVGIVSLGDLSVHLRDAGLSGEVLECVSEPARPSR